MSAWQILNRLGSGGTSIVYRAVSPEGRRVALKVLSLRGAAARDFFERQARLLIRLRHPAVVPVLGFLDRSEDIFGEDRGPCFWMEEVEGDDLFVAARSKDTQVILGWFREAVEAFRLIHGQGVVHGDLSPQNLRVDAQGRLRILDFSVLPGDDFSVDVATLPYMAPERIDGTLTPSGDLFSLGTIFYEALAGRHPRAGCRTIQELIHAAPRALVEMAPPMVAHALEARVIDRMIQAEPAGRFVTADAVARALQGGEVEESPGELPPFSPLTLIGAEDAFAVVSRALDHAKDRTVLVAVHGPSGCGVTRFRREVAFEAALRGLKCLEFPDLHRRTGAELGHVLGGLRSLPDKGALALADWGDDLLSEGAHRFVEALLSEPGVVEARLRPLDPNETARLLQGFLTVEAVSEVSKPLFKATQGIPGRILNRLRRLAAAGLIRGRSLLPGWKEAMAEKVPPKSEPADPAELSRFLRAAINRLNGTGRFGEALKVAERWFSLKAPDEPMPLKTVKYWFITGWGLHNLGNFPEAEARLKRCVQEAEPHRGDEEINATAARARSLLGLAALRRGDAKTAIQEFRETLGLQPKAGATAAETHRNLARALETLGDHSGAAKELCKAKTLYREAGHSEGIFWTFIQEGNSAMERKSFEEAERAYAEAETIARDSGSDLRQAVARNNHALLEHARRDYAAALGSLQKARDVLRYLGNPNDIAFNLKELVVVEASLGRWVRAEDRLRELREMIRSFPTAGPLAEGAEKTLNDIRTGRTRETAATLQALYERLPAELQVTFVDRGDYRKFHAIEVSMPNRSAEPVPPGVPLTEAFAAFTRLNEELLREDEIPRVLARLMDAAMEIARAESGFLVLKSDAPGGPLPGYEVAVARNVEKDQIQTDLYAFSLSAVRRALQEKKAVVTDNAVLDPLFREARSVHLRQLKSIFALPVLDAQETGGPLGVFYLDHRFESGLFSGPLLEALKAFASLAALALQKGRMIEALHANNRELSQKLQAQSRELNRSRIVLKNQYAEIVGRSAAMTEVLSLVDRITDSKVPVWIFGESGTGKESIARALHFNSARAKKPFVTENCSALPESLLESELFGHKKGAFTHATADKKGILQYADGGTILLDEIADMSLNLQAKLLRFLQEGEIRPVGSSEVIKVDVRVVSASNKNLEKLVAEGKFREDLYYRLNGVTVTLPPLRDRMEDLPLLAEHFLKRIAEREKKTALTLDGSALDLFLRYPWPGNIRELQNTLETAALFADKGRIGLQSLHFKPALFSKQAGSPLTTRTPPQRMTDEVLDPILEETLRAIRDNAYHKGYAAKALGISRRALYARLQKFGLTTDVKALKTKIEQCLRE